MARNHSHRRTHRQTQGQSSAHTCTITRTSIDMLLSIYQCACVHVCTCASMCVFVLCVRLFYTMGLLCADFYALTFMRRLLCADFYAGAQKSQGQRHTRDMNFQILKNKTLVQSSDLGELRHPLHKRGTVTACSSADVAFVLFLCGWNSVVTKMPKLTKVRALYQCFVFKDLEIHVDFKSRKPMFSYRSIWYIDFKKHCSVRYACKSARTRGLAAWISTRKNVKVRCAVL